MEADRSLFLLLLFRERHAFESSCELLLNYNGILLQGGGPSITLRKKKKKKTPWSSAFPLTSKKQLFNTRVSTYMCIYTFFCFPPPVPVA